MAGGRTNVLIMGAAGRDFHNFNTLFRGRQRFNVVAFTAAQIPGIEGRVYPSRLAGKLYPNGIPIRAEEDLRQIILGHKIGRVVFSYSDVTHQHVMDIAARVNAAGAEFVMPNLLSTMIPSKKPVVSVCAVRTGCGKSQTTRRVVEVLKEMGKTPVVVRHPMPYGNLEEQIVQRFASEDDLERHSCTIEEREEYAPHIESGTVVYAGVDYRKILRKAEKEADVIVWDGGNNDTPFYKPDLHFVVVDPLRPGHELLYYPGSTNFRLADVIVINKMDSATEEGIQTVEQNINGVNPNATIIRADSQVRVENPEVIQGKNVLVVEDGPTLTHGDMTFGAGIVGARAFGATAIDPYPDSLGSIRATYEKYRHLIGSGILPAMGYGDQQMTELERTINQLWADGKIEAVVIGTPIDLERLLRINAPSTRVRYDLKEIGRPTVESVLKDFFAGGK